MMVLVGVDLSSDVFWCLFTQAKERDEEEEEDFCAMCWCDTNIA